MTSKSESIGIIPESNNIDQIPEYNFSVEQKIQDTKLTVNILQDHTQLSIQKLQEIALNQSGLEVSESVMELLVMKATSFADWWFIMCNFDDYNEVIEKKAIEGLFNSTPSKFTEAYSAWEETKNTELKKAMEAYMVTSSNKTVGTIEIMLKSGDQVLVESALEAIGSLDGCSFNTYKRIYPKVPEGNEQKAFLLHKMMESATTFQHAMYVVNKNDGKEFTQEQIEMLKRVTITFPELLQVIQWEKKYQLKDIIFQNRTLSEISESQDLIRKTYKDFSWCNNNQLEKIFGGIHLANSTTHKEYKLSYRMLPNCEHELGLKAVQGIIRTHDGNTALEELYDMYSYLGQTDEGVMYMKKLIEGLNMSLDDFFSEFSSEILRGGTFSKGSTVEIGNLIGIESIKKIKSIEDFKKMLDRLGYNDYYCHYDMRKKDMEISIQLTEKLKELMIGDENNPENLILLDYILSTEYTKQKISELFNLTAKQVSLLKKLSKGQISDIQSNEGNES